MGEVLVAVLNVNWRGTHSAMGIKSGGGLREHHGVHGDLSVGRDLP